MNQEMEMAAVTELVGMTGVRAPGAKRNAFSLMEVILATAILAASGAALLGLIGQASRFALSAERRTIALMHAETLLDEYLVNRSFEMQGTVASDPGWSYTIEAASVASSASSLERVEVSVFEGGDGSATRSSDSRGENVPVVQIVRWVKARSGKTGVSDQESPSNSPSARSALDERN